jgi:hypothetical protein
MTARPAHRPPIATVFGVVSLLWGVATLGGSLLWIGVFALIGAGSWLAGPVAGVLGTAVGVVGSIYLVLASLLSFILLAAGWYTLQGDMRGVSLHRTWAWTSIILDAFALLFSGGLAANGYFGLIYAIAVLYCTTPREVEARWEPAMHGPAGKAKPTHHGDPDF